MGSSRPTVDPDFKVEVNQVWRGRWADRTVRIVLTPREGLIKVLNVANQRTWRISREQLVRKYAPQPRKADVDVNVTECRACGACDDCASR